MYKVWGSDEKEYGPVDEQTLRQWLAEQRVTPETYVLPEGAAQWQTVATLPEFASATPSPAPAPGLRMTAAEEVARPVVTPTMTGTAPLLRQRPKTSGLAIASLILGLLGLCTAGLTSVVGLILGIISLRTINRSQGVVRGKGLAVAGVVVSGIFVAFIAVAFGAGLFVPAFAAGKMRAQAISCVGNLKQLSLAIHQYAGEKNNTLPAANQWCDAIANKVDATAFRCLADASGARCSYAFNRRLSGRKLAGLPADTVLLFETTGGWNSSGGAEAMLTAPRHKVINVAFVDGSVQQLTPLGLQRLRWEP